MMKKTGAFLLALVIMVCSLSAYAAGHEDYDYSIFTPQAKAYSIGGFLSEQAVADFGSFSEEIEEQYGINLVFVITDDFDGEVEEFSDYIFLYSPLGEEYNTNIIMLTVDMNGRRVDLYTHGLGQQAISDRSVDYILDEVAVPALKSGNYEQLPMAFGQKAAEIVSDWASQPPDEYIPPSGGGTSGQNGTNSKPKGIGSFIPASLIFGLIVSGVMLAVNISKHRPVRAATEANRYMVSDSFNLTEKRDVFLRTYTARVKIPKQDNNLHSGGSSHSHSSGHSHGGGSRGF